MKRFLPFIALIALAQSCAFSVHQVHVSDFTKYHPAKQAKVVSSSAEQFVILGIVSNVDYVDAARKKLESKCRRGNIIGITTEYRTALGFFSWTNKVLMKGRCIKST